MATYCDSFDATVLDVYDTRDCLRKIMTAPVSTLRAVFSLHDRAVARLRDLFDDTTGVFVVDLHFNGSRRTPWDEIYVRRPEITVPREVEVTNLDKDGFNGRDNFPVDADLHTRVFVDKVERVNDDAVGPMGDTHEDESYLVFYCHREDGSRVELIGHEVEAV
jgi:hypothetical protein